MGRRPSFVAVCAAGLVLALNAGCSGSATKGSGKTTTLPAAGVTTTAPTTTLPAKATVGASSSVEAANQLVAAWEAHDRAAASRGADVDAVKGIFATPDPQMWLRGCSTDDTLPEGGCIYRTEHGLVQVNTEKRPIGWVVVSATYEAL